MKRLALALVLGSASLAHAMNPDMEGYLSGAASFEVSHLSQAADYLSPLGIRYVVSYGTTSAYGLGLLWVQSLYDPLSVSLGLDYGTFGSESKITRQTAPAGNEAEMTTGSELQFSTGVRLYAAGLFYSYDPSIDRNPAGRLYWPSLRVEYVSGTLNEDNVTSQADGSFGGFNGAFTYTGQSRSMSYRGMLPVASSLTLYTHYTKEIAHSSSISGPLVPATSSSGDGSVEGIGSGMIIYANDDRDTQAALSPYVPHAGLPGRLRFDISYFQNYSLAAGRLINHVYSFGAGYVFANGVALNVALDQAEMNTSRFDYPGYTITQSSTTSRDLNIGLRWGWGKVRKAGAEEVEAEAMPQPVPEKKVELDAHQTSQELKATRAKKDSLLPHP